MPFSIQARWRRALRRRQPAVRIPPRAFIVLHADEIVVLRGVEPRTVEFASRGIAAAVAPLDWRQAVAAPARDLGLAGRAWLQAAGRLARGLLGLAAWVLVRPWAAWRADRGAARSAAWGLRSG